jgi:hypothetical protein
MARSYTRDSTDYLASLGSCGSAWPRDDYASSCSHVSSFSLPPPVHAGGLVWRPSGQIHIPRREMETCCSIKLPRRNIETWPCKLNENYKINQYWGQAPKPPSL